VRSDQKPKGVAASCFQLVVESAEETDSSKRSDIEAISFATAVGSTFSVSNDKVCARAA
jgi:hypothetical protein